MLFDTDEEIVSEAASGQAKRPRALSQVLEELAARQSGRDVSVRTIRDALADRSFATFLLLTCLFNLLPFPPGSTLILGIPVIAVAVQMVLGMKTVWLPRFFLNMSLNAKTFSKLTTVILPRMRRLEQVIRPRFWPFANRKMAERMIGIIALLFGIFVFVPLPFTNWLPALAGAICALALSERDGIWLTIGLVFGILSMTIIAIGYYMGGIAVSGMIW
ncbi:MAG: exopolysaccharide biosynthesis protein [Pseudomonadota bacterium]